MFHSTNASGPYVIFQNSTGNFGDIGSELAITGGGSAGNLTLNSRSTSNLCLSVNDTVRARIDSSGNVGVGVTPSAWWSNEKALQIGSGAYFSGRTANPDVAEIGANQFINSSLQRIYIANGYASRYQQDGGVHQWFTAPSGTAGNAITFTQAMTLDASGRLFVGKTSSSAANTGCELQTGTGGNAASVFTADAGSASIMNRLTSDGTIIDFRRQTVSVGSISVTTTATAYNTSSDYRLKESAQPLVGGLARVNALKPSAYKWKANGSAGEGFLAHELSEVIPLAVTGDKDAVDADGKPSYQGVDLSKLVPILVAAIQELTAEVNALKNA
jgi:hypothetical protein